MGKEKIITNQSVAQDLEQARLSFVAELHELVQKIVKGKEQLIADIIAWEHGERQIYPYTRTMQITEDGDKDTPMDMYGVALEAVYNGTGTVTVKVNGSNFPYTISNTPVYIVQGNTITSVSVAGIAQGKTCYVKLFNKQAALLR